MLQGTPIILRRMGDDVSKEMTWAQGTGPPRPYGLRLDGNVLMKGRGKRLFKDLLDTDTIVLLALEPL